jgi:hypothetical protein
VMYNKHAVTVGARWDGGGTALVDELGRSALVVEADVPCGRSSCHVINKVLMPGFRTIAELLTHNPDPSGNLAITAFAVGEAREAARYHDAAANLTLLAPTNAAWHALARARGVSLETLIADRALMDSVLDQMTLTGACVCAVVCLCLVCVCLCVLPTADNTPQPQR